ncbi:MAG: hypothetical protein M1834_005829 [Cirrosporium novae-zelandiae]|nr:MAG: hypothetical protein M1834_005829 [Cirrosporium novae-zelandiae]
MHRFMFTPPGIVAAFEREMWPEYGIGMAAFILRFLARWKVVGLRNFKGDDWMSLLATILWTLDSVIMYLIVIYGSSVGLNEKTAEELTDEQVRRYTIGSKALTDIGILAIPIPILFQVRIRFYRKIILALLICSGIFVIIAALLRCILSLASVEHAGFSAIWAIRETFVSVLAVSAPAIKPLFNKSVWFSSADGSNQPRFKGFFRPRSVLHSDHREGASSGAAYELRNVKTADRISKNGSEECIIGKDEDPELGHSRNLRIQVTTEYRREEAEDSGSLQSGNEIEDLDNAWEGSVTGGIKTSVVGGIGKPKSERSMSRTS